MLGDVSDTFDPQEAYYNINWELYRCCLLRTLMSYKGVDTAEGGAAVFPDLAAADGQQSTDGLTWTFKIKPGIHYSPPLANLTVKAQDFVRAINREACSSCTVHGYPFYYGAGATAGTAAIVGFAKAYAANSTSAKPQTVSGIKALDDTTLQIKLTAPEGDLPFRFAMAATAPIPPLPGHPSAPFGIATGHDTNDGRFSLVGTGPYMIKGTDKLDFSVAPGKQTPVSGYTPNRSIVFVQNPKWSSSTDSLRQQNVAEMDFTIGGTEEDAAHKVDSGVQDFCFDCPPIADQDAGYLKNGDPTHRVQIHPSDAVRYISFNLATPPFDDIHVRKAVNFAIDKNGLRSLRGGALVGSIAHHIIVDSLENNALLHFDPYATPNDKGSLAKAKNEMKQSTKYDPKGDGMCDVAACKGILTIIDQNPPYPDQTNLIAQDLKPLGMTLTIKSGDRSTFMYPTCADPTKHAALCPSVAWGKDYADAFTFGPPLFGKASIGSTDYGLVGADSSLLKKDGYSVTTVPSVEKQLKTCGALVGAARVTCWANFDKFLMTNVVPWVPYLFDNTVNVIAKRVQCYSYDQFAGDISIDHLCIVP